MGNLVKTVEMRILASAGDAQAQLDELTAKADKLDGDAIRMRFRLDDSEGRAQLDAIKARADELGFKDVSIKVRVDGAGKAIAELMAVKHEADKAGGPNMLRSLMGGLFTPLGGGLGPLPAAVTSPAGLAGLAAAAAAALVELTGLVSGFAAAGAGAGAFALLAVPAVKKVETAYSGLNAAQQAYQAAQAKEAEAPTKANKTALANAALNLDLARDAIKKMPAPEQGAIKGIDQLVTSFGKMSTAFQPQAFQVFAAGLKLLNNLLPTVTPFAKTFADAMSGLLGKLNGALFSKQVTDVARGIHGITGAISSIAPSAGFQKFLDQFHALEGPAITAIGQGLGKVFQSIGKLLTTMNAADVAKSIGIAFNTIAGIISGVASVVKTLMSNWDGMSSAAKTATHAVASAFDSMRTGVMTSVNGVISTVSSIGGKIKGVFADAIGWLKAAGKAIVQGLIDGIGSMVGAAVSAAAHVGSSVVGAITSFLGIHSPSTVMHKIGQQTMQGLITGMNSQLVALRMAAAHAAAAVASAIKTEMAYAKSVAASAVTGLSLTSINLTSGTVTSGMQDYLATLKSFTADIKALSGQHLNKDLLKQLIAAGPVTGDQYAQSILQGGGAGQVNALYKQITQQSATLGAQAAMAMYGNKVTPSAGGGFTIVVNVNSGPGTGTAGLQGQGQALALEIIKVLKEYKRHGGGAPLGIA